MPDQSPTVARGLELHEQLLAGSEIASALIAEEFLPWLRRRMAELHNRVSDPHLLDTACIDALQSYFRNPRSFEPTKLPLGKYFLMAAGGDLRNTLKQMEKAERRGAEISKILVELGAFASEQPAKADQLETQVRFLIPDPSEQKVFSLMADGVRDTATFGKVLGISDLPIEDQRHMVKACKDRILKRLKDARHRGSLRPLKGED